MKNPDYYEKLGFKCGLEIHQRLATSHKLFCRCSASMAEDAKIGEVERVQRAVVGELGVLDVSTAFEGRKKRRFIYNIFRKSSCLVDLDEEPPMSLSEEALGIALLIASSLNAMIPDEIEPMRKEVVDGSDPSAFQRSMLVATDGKLLINGRYINIPTIFLEEESSGIESSGSDAVNYNLDRLGIPLVEIDTDATISTPSEAKELAMRIGLILRLTGRVQRGIGSIRQDVNISIKGGTRIELKGFQEVDTMDEIIDREIERQLKLIEIRESLSRKAARVHEPKALTEIFQDSDAKIIKESIESGAMVLGFRLEGFKGFLGREVNPGRRLGSEISDYAKMAGVKGLIHSDENLDSYRFRPEELQAIRKKLDIKEDDAFILIAAKENVCKYAAELAKERAEYSLIGVPSETRGVDSRAGITRFLRPIPGGSRMYPETDAIPVEVNKKEYEIIKSNKVDPDAIRSRLIKEIKNEQLAEQMLWSRDLQLYNEIVEKTGARPATVASIILERFKEMKRSGINIESLHYDILIKIFSLFSSGSITRLGAEEIIRELPQSEKGIYSIIERKRLKKLSGDSLKELVRSALAAEGDRNKVRKELMSKYRVSIDGEELNSILESMRV